MRLPIDMIAIILALNVIANADGRGAEQKPLVFAPAFFTGNDYLGMPEQQQMIYVAGVLDGLMLAPLFGALQPKKLSGCVSGKPISQAHAIVAKYLKEHPEEWQLQAGALVYNAFNGACGPHQ